MKIFMTGATGYIGRHVLDRLIGQGHHVNILCRNSPEGKIFQHPEVTIFKGDLLDRDVIFNATRGCDQVYHIAAFARVWAKNPATFFEINVQGTVNVLDAARHCAVSKVVFTSTGGTYGVSNGRPITEDMIRTRDFFNEYESSKFMAEEKVLCYALQGLNVVIVHPVRIYGPGILTESNPVSYMMKAYLKGDWHIIPGNGKAISSFTYIDDVVNGHILAMEKGRPGEKYILGGVNTNFSRFFRTMAEISDRRYFLMKLPVPMMMAYAWKEEMNAKLFGSTPTITRKWIRKYRYDMACCSDKAIAELGYNITPLEEGIMKTIQWMERTYHIYHNSPE
jgi:NAD+-dependent farnesol dehydrogenase